MNPKKIPIALVDFRFLERMAAMLDKGNKEKPDRKPFDYENLEPFTPELSLEFESALLRHFKEFKIATMAPDAIDALASIAANCQILAYHCGLKNPGFIWSDEDDDQAMTPDYFDNDEPDPITGWTDQGFEGFHYYENSNRALCGALLPCGPTVEPLQERPPDRNCIGCGLLFSDPDRPLTPTKGDPELQKRTALNEVIVKNPGWKSIKSFVVAEPGGLVPESNCFFCRNVVPAGVFMFEILDKNGLVGAACVACLEKHNR